MKKTSCRFVFVYMTACHVKVDVDENEGNSQTNAMRQLMSNF
jgi:hypothetical protein